MFTAWHKARLDQFLLKIFYYGYSVLDVGGVSVIHQADDVVIQHPEPGGEEVEVDELCWWPDDPLSQIQPPTKLDCLTEEIGSCLVFKFSSYKQAGCDADRTEQNLVKHNFLDHHPDPSSWDSLVEIVVPEMTQESRSQPERC